MAGKGTGNRARLNPAHDKRTREKIQTAQIINRLISLTKGEIEMSPHAVTAALGLLRKTLPDLSAVEHTGDAAQPFAVIPKEITSSAAWERLAKPQEARTAPEANGKVKH